MAANTLPSLDLSTLPSLVVPNTAPNVETAVLEVKSAGAAEAASDEAEKVAEDADKEDKLKAENDNKDGDEKEAEEEEEEDPSAVLDAQPFQLPEDYRFTPYVTPEEAARMTAFLNALTDEQLRRYETYRRTALPRASMKRVMMSMTGTTVPPNSVIVMSGIAKVYCGEVIEAARIIREEWKDSGPLLPKHLREAVRRLRRKAPYTVTGAPAPKGGPL